MQLLQRIGAIGINGLPEIPQDGFGALKQPVEHCVLNGAVILHFINDKMLNQAAFLQAGKGRLQIKIGVHVVPLQHPLLYRHIQLGAAEPLVKILISRQGVFQPEHLF